MSKFKLAAGVILLVLVGALIGSLGTGLLIKQKVERFGLGGPGPPEGAGYIIKRLAPRLDLTASQRTDIRELFDDYNEKIFDVRSQYLPEIKKINDQTFSSLREKLNDKQKEKLNHLQKRVDRLRERVPFRRRSPARKLAHRVDSIMGQLELTQEQTAHIRPIIVENLEKKKALFEGARGMDRPERYSGKQELDRIDGQTEEKLAPFLSQDQMEAYQNLSRANHFGKRPRRDPPGFMDEPFPMDPNPSP